jgi:hypothetical protein
VADQVDLGKPLDAHDPEQLAVVLVAPELDAGRDLAVQLAHRHVRLVPAVGRDYAAVRLGCGVDDREDRLALVVTARADARHRSPPPEAPPPNS